MTPADSGAEPPRILIAAFEGWSDAGAATTTVLQHLGELMHLEPLHAIGAEGYVDFQVHRPKLGRDEHGNRVLDWPDTRLFGEIQRPGIAGLDSPGEALAEMTEDTVRRLDGSRARGIFLLAGVEPSRDWRSFADEIVELVDVWGIDSVVLLGSMYSDSPHSRPIAVSLSSENPKVRAATGATRSDYEGPVGISTVIDLAFIEAGIDSLSLWAEVPHYVHSSPSPKATLALLDKLEELLDIVIPRGELLDEATEWEANINRIADADEDMSRYIRTLEESRDATMAAEASGDAIAMEFERLLDDARLLSDTGSTDADSADPGSTDAEGKSAETPKADDSVTEDVETEDADTENTDSGSSDDEA
ncbi:proteasome assembly chaperone family protein [Leucobacter sp. GX24907]